MITLLPGRLEAAAQGLALHERDGRTGSCSYSGVIEHINARIWHSETGHPDPDSDGLQEQNQITAEIEDTGSV